MKKLLIWLVLVPFFAGAQSYVDLVKIGYGNTFNNRFDGTDHTTQISSLEGDLTFPIVLGPRQALVTGVLFSRNELQLFPGAEFTGLYNTALKLGLSSTWDGKWTTTVVLLPKIASDYQNVTSEDLFFGGFASLNYKKHDRLIYRFGAYGSTEAFGFFTTPFFGWYYLSQDERLEMDFTLPISADLNYSLGATSVGIDYFGIGRSFNLSGTTPQRPEASYVDLSSLEFSTYLQFNTLNRSVLLRAKFGYASNDYEVYRQNEKIDLGLSAFSFGDDRNQINPSVSGGFFVKFEAIYRFRLPDTDRVENKNSN